MWKLSYVLSEYRVDKTGLSQHTSEYHTCPFYNDIMLIGMNEQEVQVY